MTQHPAVRLRSLWACLGDEGLRLFFPLAALHAALWPLLWTVLYQLDMPAGGRMSPSLWHGGEMMFGTYGAALIGFVTTAVPEWTNTPRPRGHALSVLAGLWGVGRLSGLIGHDGLGLIGMTADSLWLAALVAYVGWAWRMARQPVKLFGPLFWLCGLTIGHGCLQWSFAIGDNAAAQWISQLNGLLLLGLLGLILGRLTLPITNRVLDPSRDSTPFRPHPGRMNLAPGLVAVAICGELANLSPAVNGYLMIAAGAAFMDRLSDAFIGRDFFRAEIQALAASALFSGLGLILGGAARLGAPFAETSALHLALMGGLGIGVLAVFCVAGLIHTGRDLPLPSTAPLTLILLVSGVVLRVMPEVLALPLPPGPPHALAALAWAMAFLLWLRIYWPFFSTPNATSPDLT